MTRPRYRLGGVVLLNSGDRFMYGDAVVTVAGRYHTSPFDAERNPSRIAYQVTFEADGRTVPMPMSHEDAALFVKKHPVTDHRPHSAAAGKEEE